MAGEEVTVWGAGLDLGDFTVSATGTIDLTLNQAESLFTLTYLARRDGAGLHVPLDGNPRDRPDRPDGLRHGGERELRPGAYREHRRADDLPAPS
jgi:hypothetical protein